MKIVCKDCGWEILNAQWWNRYNKEQWVCDDCDLNDSIKRHPANTLLRTGETK